MSGNKRKRRPILHEVSIFTAQIVRVPARSLDATTSLDREAAQRLQRSVYPMPTIHFGLMASRDAVVKPGGGRDRIAVAQCLRAFASAIVLMPKLSIM
jgi:hypothetical protein